MNTEKNWWLPQGREVAGLGDRGEGGLSSRNWWLQIAMEK